MKIGSWYGMTWTIGRMLPALRPLHQREPKPRPNATCATDFVGRVPAAGGANRSGIQTNLMKIANAPGTKIGPGEIAKGLKVLASGGDVDYVGATNVEFNKVGEVLGSFKELEVKNGKFETIKIH